MPDAATADFNETMPTEMDPFDLYPATSSLW